MLPPVVLGALRQGVEAAQGAAVRHLALTLESAGLAEYAKVRACVSACARVVMGAAAVDSGCAIQNLQDAVCLLRSLIASCITPLILAPAAASM